MENQDLLIHISNQLYRLEAVLRAAEESLTEADQARLLIETAREMTWTIHNDVEDLLGDEKIERPEGLG